MYIQRIQQGFKIYVCVCGGGGVGAGDLSTFLDYGPCSRMIKDPCVQRQKDRGEKENQRVNRGSQEAEASQEYFRQSTILERGAPRKVTEPCKQRKK